MGSIPIASTTFSHSGPFSVKILSVLTSNPGKFEDIERFLTSPTLKVEQVSVDLEEIQEVDALKIIHHKIEEAKCLGYTDFILEDTSLYFDGLNRLPGPLIKWFLEELKTTGLYTMASCMGTGAAMAETVLAYVAKDEAPQIFVGSTGGRIVPPLGSLGFGWSNIFQPDNCLKTYAEMLYEEKLEWNQRIKALKAFKAYWDTLQTQQPPAGL